LIPEPNRSLAAEVVLPGSGAWRRMRSSDRHSTSDREEFASIRDITRAGRMANTRVCRISQPPTIYTNREPSWVTFHTCRPYYISQDSTRCAQEIAGKERTSLIELANQRRRKEAES
jgi:hypothetical protein